MTRIGWISRRTGQFAYFDALLGRPDWTGKRVLDFGGNVGNLLLDPQCAIAPENYWCLDVVAEAVQEGSRRHPNAHFVHYDRYHHEYHPTGTLGHPLPDLGLFDVIVAWSVFSHTCKLEMLELVGELRNRLTDDGRLAFSYIDPFWTPPEGWARGSELPGLSNLQWRLYWRGKESPNFDVEATEERAKQGLTSWGALLDDELLLDPDYDNRGISLRTDDGAPALYMSFCTPEHMREIFPDAEVALPAPPERQACVILGKRAR